MTITELSLKAINKIPVMKKVSQSFCRYAITHKTFRKWMNKRYNKLNNKERILFHYLFARIFRNIKRHSLIAEWIVLFNGTEIKMPLNGENLWLDWDLAVSILGHDLEIKNFYKDYINLKKPKLFFDIGANYGTHSILFLSQKIQTVTFEPNPSCKPVFYDLLNANKLEGKLENIAVGDKASVAELVFPKTDTWYGTLDTNYQKEIESLEEINHMRVEIITLDEFVEKNKIIPDIIKIDTEGFELNVIKGAKKLLKENQITIIFETNRPFERDGLFVLFELLNYNIYLIQEFLSPKFHALTKAEFINSRETNFVAFKNVKSLV